MKIDRAAYRRVLLHDSSNPIRASPFDIPEFRRNHQTCDSRQHAIFLFSQISGRRILLKNRWHHEHVRGLRNDGTPRNSAQRWNSTTNWARMGRFCPTKYFCMRRRGRLYENSLPYFAAVLCSPRDVSRQVPGFLPAFSVRLKIIFRRRQNSIQAAWCFIKVA